MAGLDSNDIQQTPQRRFAIEVVKKLRQAGYQALWAGGCVRDQLLGLQPKDFDVATSARPEQVQALFGPRRTYAVGAAFGVITVVGPRDAGQVEVATFRQDDVYTDGRRPDSVTFSDAQTDALRRDFTINGLFFDPLENVVHDYVQGQADLQARVLRAIGDPAARLAEDKLRMLRAIRFATRFELALDPATWQAVCSMVSQVHVVSPERIGAEMRRMLVDRHRASAWKLLKESGLLAELLPELSELGPVGWNQVLEASERLQEPGFPLAMAAALLPLSTAGMAGVLGNRWRLSNQETDRMRWLLVNLDEIWEAEHRPWSQVQRLVAHEGGHELVALAAAAKPAAFANTQAFLQTRLAWPRAVLDPPPLIGGADLIAAGFATGPAFRQLLEAVRNAQLDGKIHTKEEALALAAQLYLG